jgi:hypothetical protein
MEIGLKSKSTLGKIIRSYLKNKLKQNDRKCGSSGEHLPSKTHSPSSNFSSDDRGKKERERVRKRERESRFSLLRRV